MRKDDAGMGEIENGHQNGHQNHHPVISMAYTLS